MKYGCNNIIAERYQFVTLVKYVIISHFFSPLHIASSNLMCVAAQERRIENNQKCNTRKFLIEAEIVSVSKNEKINIRIVLLELRQSNVSSRKQDWCWSWTIVGQDRTQVQVRMNGHYCNDYCCTNS